MYIYLTVPILPNYKKENSTKNFIRAPNLIEAKSYLKLVIGLFFLIDQVEYGMFALVVQALDSEIYHYTADEYRGN